MEKIGPVIFCTPFDDGVCNPLILFTAHIVALYTSKRRTYRHFVVLLANGEEWVVKDTPEDILQMMSVDPEDSEYVTDMFEAIAADAEEEEA